MHKPRQKGSFVTSTQVFEFDDDRLLQEDTRKKILIVDDDPELIDIYCRILDRDYQVIAAYSGAEAVKAAKQEKPDLIVMDIMMEDPYAGLNAANKLASSGLLKHTPLIFLTSVSQRFDYSVTDAALDFQPDDWMSKPVRPALLLSTIAGYLE